MLNTYIKSLNNSLEKGQITQSLYLKQLKNYYDLQGEILDEASLNFVETKLNEANIPISTTSTDGVIKQAMSGLLEGFTTFGFADKPDTPMEKIVNNVGHLIGLAPGVVLGGGRMLTGAARTVGNALIRRGAAEKNKSLVKFGKKLEQKSEVYSKSNVRAQKFLGKIADKLRFTTKDGKVDFNLRSMQPVSIDPRNNKNIYELKSVPGKIADVVQNQALRFMGENKAGALDFVTKGILRGQFSNEAVGRILHEAGHVGLLMAFSNHPLAARNEGGLSAEGVKAMAFAGMHGSLAGAIFGSIGQYANISKLMTSTNPAMVKAGEKIIRNTAKTLSTKNTQEAEQFVNTIVRGTAGAGYGGITAKINDLPVEEQIYETLMGVFFSVNARPTWEAKATKDININANLFNRLNSKEEQLSLLRRQDWFVRESKDYQRYWENHFDAIRQQQLTSREHISDLVQQRILRAVQELEKTGKIRQEEINAVLEGKSSKEGALDLLSELVQFRDNLRDPNYNINIDVEPYKPNELVDMTWLTQANNWITQQKAGNTVDFPAHSLTEVYKRVQAAYGEKVNEQQFIGDTVSIYNKLKNDKKSYTIDPRTERRVVDVDKFVEQIKKKYKNTQWDSNALNETRRIALRFDFLREVQNDYMIDFTAGKPKTRSVGKPQPTPKEDPQGNNISKLTTGIRDNFADFRNMKLETISYMQVYDSGTGKPIWVSPLSRQVYVDKKSGELKVAPYVKTKQWIEFEKEQLNKRGKFIYGGVADTGRLDVRTYPWAPPPAKGKKASPYHWNSTVISNLHKAIYKEILSTKEGKEWYSNLDSNVKDLNKESKANTVATMIYRMRELGLITRQQELNTSNLEAIVKKIPRYFRAEKEVGGYGNEAKSQKYLKLLDTSDITFLEGKKLGLKDDTMKGIILEDLNLGRINESETDGTIILPDKIFDRHVDYMGGDQGTGMAKGSLYAPPRNGESLVIGKYAYARADKADMAYMKKHGLSFIMYTTSAKHFYNRPVNKLNPKNYDPTKSTEEQSIYPDKPETTDLQTKDFTWSIDIREKINVTGKLNMMQQMFLNANGVQFDKSTEVGRKFYDSWEKLLSENVDGVDSVNKAAEKAIKKNESWDNLNIDEISINLINDIVSNRTKHPAFKSIIKHLYYENKHNMTLDPEKGIQEQLNERHVGQHLADGGYELTALMERGNSKFVEKTLRNYIISRIVRPQVQYSYSSVLAPYDWKYSLKKQQYSSAEKGLADNEFMLWPGAKKMRVRHPISGKEISLGKWWEQMRDVLNQNKRKKFVRELTPEQKQKWLDSQYAIINRSPIMTAGNMRALKFIGFAGGKADKGFALITNSRNDMMLGGADKDIDSAHLSWGMPRDIKEGYKQDHVQFEFAKDKQRKEDYELKDDDFISETLGIDVSKPDKSPYGIIHLGNKLKAAEASTYGKNSLGIIDNGFTAIKQIADLDLQRRTDLTQAEKLEIWQTIARLNAGIGNRFVDASEVTSIESAFKYVQRAQEYLYDTYNINTRKREVKFYNKFIKGLMKGNIADYGKEAEKMLARQRNDRTISSLLAENIKDLNLKVDPLVGMKKNNIYGVMREVNNILEKDPYAKAFGIDNKAVYDNIIFNDALLTKQEKNAILNNPHFLYNKMNPIRVLKAMEKTYDFFDKTHKDLGDKSIHTVLREYTGMSRGQLDSFVKELIHTAQYQKFMYSGASDAKLRRFAFGSKNMPDRMSYPELVMMSKERLQKDLMNYYADKNLGTEIPDSAKARINKEVVRLFEYWHEANPALHLNFNAMPKEIGANLQKLQKEIITTRNQITNVMRYINGNKSKGRRRNTIDMDKWSFTDRQKYDNLKKKLADLEYELLRFQPEGINNMARNAAISKEVKRDIYKYERDMLDAVQEPTPARMESKLYDMVNLPGAQKIKDVDGPGVIADNKVVALDNGRFASQITNWEALGKAKDFKKEIQNQLGKLDKQIEKKYKMPPEALIKELDRFEDILTKMVLHGNTAHVLDLSSIYLKSFEKLNVISGVEIDPTTEAPLVDYNHLRVFSNILENRYMTGWKEWGARKSIHKKYVKEIKEMEKESGEKIMPPEFDTDLMFPSEVSKMFEKVEKTYKIGTAKVTKGGLLKDVGVRIPTTTVESIGQSIGSANTRGNTLKEAIEADFKGKLKLIEPENISDYKKAKDILEGLAAYERQLGPDLRGPREFEADQSIENLKKNVKIYTKKLEDFVSKNPNLRFRVKGIGEQKSKDYTPREYVDLLKDVYTRQMTESFALMHESNWVELEKIIGGENFVKGDFGGGIFNFNRFYNIKKGEDVVSDINSSEYKHRKLSELFLDKEGVINPDRVMFIETYNLNDRRLAEGKNTLRRHFHTEDITWIEFQLDIRDLVLEKYGTIKKDGSIDLDYAKLRRVQSDKVKGTMLDEMRNFIRETNNNKLENSFIGFIGTEEVNGSRFSDRYHPLYHPKTKAYLEFVQNVHIPQETLRLYGELYNTKTKETYRTFEEIDIEAFKRGDVIGRYKSSTGLSEGQLKVQSTDLFRSFERGFITKKDAADALYRNMVNKLINNPEQYNNDFYDGVTFDRLMNISTRTGGIDAPGVGKFSTVRRRAPIPVEGYDITSEAYTRYIKTSSIGVTSQQAALIARLHISNFKNKVLPGNKRIDADVGRQWLHKIVDITKGYMNMPSTRSMQLHGVTEKDMKLLERYANSNYSMHFGTKEGDIINKKLLNDFRMYTRPSDSEIRSMQNELYADSGLKNLEIKFKEGIKQINDKDYTYIDPKTKKTIKPTRKQIDRAEKIRAKAFGVEKKKIVNKLRKELYGQYIDTKGKLIKRDNISQIDYAENTIIKTNGDVVKFDRGKSTDGMIRKRTLEYRNDFIFKKDADGKKTINRDNIDITGINKSFRGFYSEETVGNVFLRLEQKANKLLGHLTDGRIQIMKDLPNDPSARHAAMVNKLNWISDIEGKFEMMSLLAHPKSALANLYGGTTNLITDVGFEHYLDTFSEKKLLEVFRDKTISEVDPVTNQRTTRPIRSKKDVHTYFESFGFLESNIINELAYLRPATDTDWQSFVNVVGPKIAEAFQKLPVYTADANTNARNQTKRDQVIQEQLTVTEAAKKFGINKKLLDLGSLAMSSTERHLRIKTAIAHYLKARSMMTDSRGQVEVSEQFLLEYAQKGIEATQFIYHATNRPNFANTAFGRIMTRFHPYSWNSIRRRANLITDYMLTEGYGNFDANKRFERQLSADMMVTALGTVFMASMFEYALSPPMSWAVDASHLMFGSQEEKERAFYNQYGHPLLSPLSIVTPPAARFVLGPTTSLINNDFEAFWKYTAATAFPFGRLTRDVLRTADTPEMWSEFIFGVPVHRFARLGKRPDLDKNEENEE